MFFLFRTLKNQCAPIRSRLWLAATLAMTMLLASGCSVYQFDESSLDAGISPTTTPAPFRIENSELSQWLPPESESAPVVEVQTSTSSVKDENWGSFFVSLLTLSLIPNFSEFHETAYMNLDWNGETLATSSVNYDIDMVEGFYFPTPLLFPGTLNDKGAERKKATPLVNKQHFANLAKELNQQRPAYESIDPRDPDALYSFIMESSEARLFKPLAVQQLATLAPEDNPLDYHIQYASIPGYLDLVPARDRAWLIGPDGLRGLDLQAQLEQGVDADELLIRMLNAYPPESEREARYVQVGGSWTVVQGITAGYYTGMTDEHRDILKDAGLPEGLVDRMTNDEPSPQLLIAAKSGKLRDESGNIRIPTAEELLEQLVRKDNQGQYMSPYTSDDVLAEWVNSAINANIGATVGTGVGAVAGAYAAEKALDFVPFGLGGLVGGAVGAEVGKSLGRETAISASGGWEAIKASSDRSFNSLADMARYLKEKYGHTENFSEAMAATQQIYPELAEHL